MAGRRRQRRDEGLGRGAERGDLRVPRADQGAQGDRAATDGALELRALRAADEGGRLLRLRAQQWSPEPGGPLPRAGPRRDTRVAARSQHALAGRDRRACGCVLQRRRDALGVGERLRRLRLDRVAGAGGRDGTGPVRPGPLVEVLRSLVAKGRLGLLLQPLRGAPGGRRPHGPQQEPEGLFPPGGHGAGRGRARLRAKGPARLGSSARR